MSKYPTIPEPDNTVEGLTNTIRALKQTVELLAGLRQGADKGALTTFYQTFTPQVTNPNAEYAVWINPTDNKMYYWRIESREWVEVGS